MHIRFNHEVKTRIGTPDWAVFKELLDVLSKLDVEAPGLLDLELDVAFSQGRMYPRLRINMVTDTGRALGLHMGFDPQLQLVKDLPSAVQRQVRIALESMVMKQIHVDVL